MHDKEIYGEDIFSIQAEEFNSYFIGVHGVLVRDDSFEQID